jgi:hypothetical protein
VTALTGRELEQARRELAASLALARPDSTARISIIARIRAIDTELATPAATAQSAGSPLPGLYRIYRESGCSFCR